MYTTASDAAINIVDGNWSIVAVSKISILQICLFRTVTICHLQFTRNDAFGDDSKLQDAINVNTLWDSENGMSLASH